MNNDIPLLKGKKVLVADDSESIRELISVVLTIKGAEVIEAKNGMHAVAMALEEKPDIIFMDIHMPGCDGVNASKSIKVNNDSSFPPIILFSADQDSLEEASKDATLFADSIEKPFTISDLLDKTIDVLSRSDI